MHYDQILWDDEGDADGNYRHIVTTGLVSEEEVADVIAGHHATWEISRRRTVSTKSCMTPEQAKRIAQPEFRAEARSVRESLERERREQGKIATTGESIEPEDAVALAKFIGCLRQAREQAGLSLTDVSDRSGIDKSALSRLENGFTANPTIHTLARYSRAVGKRFVPALED